ncbi:hypothetical protein SMACR_08693 [Sordaria macrospora]|uniref:WGS project CABT00000000 data, contig 2.63 n=2 Tax=Sordaria macrospora TaxID=5147 RepID=F7WAP0_SORMK|nr:uncharacterized protein SMAC_08693 [Sordaria macrospora k-hell]KAA8629579.1 hypothetical protein SMACR_08693 [Sordaria macrospora]WPJ67282.1 hypothetical protein SMAC4_08693 [Sordaria macrospora]CCC14235.1 unnamed protein product [Sordaria macrospora k-hell]
MSTTLHNKRVPALGRLWSMFGTGSWDRSPSNPKLKCDDDDENSSKSLTLQRPLLPAGSVMGNISTVIYLLWEFSKNDIFTFSLPCTIFGVALSLAKEATTTPSTPSLGQVLSRLPAICLFQLYSLLLFDLANQRHPIAVAEDLINKPWRPIPSGKITSDQTRRLFLCLVPIAMALNYALGVWHEGLLVLIVIFVYNDLGCADEPVFRDILLGISYGIYHVGSLRIALGLGQHAQREAGINVSMADVISARGYAWTAIVSALIATMISIQDLKDQDGDRARGNRTTIPLLIGETASRYQLAATALTWAVVGVVFWKTPVWYAAPFVGFAGYIAWRLLARRNKVDDEVTWRNWCRWTMMVYSLPAVSALSQ